jgi:TolB protein
LKHALASMLIVLAPSLGACQPEAEAPEALDWRELEAPLLTHHVQLTQREWFVKAGEAYFNPDASWIVFQAVPAPPAGQKPDEFYSMYVARLSRNSEGRIVGVEKPILISPPGSANTCGWFHPRLPGTVIWGSTLTAPATDQRSGFQVGARKYVWLFPEETEIVGATIPAIFMELKHGKATGERSEIKPEVLFARPDYDAECSFSADGRHVLYAHVREGEKTAGRADADIWVYDTKSKQHTELVKADGYDGGPFFSPDGKRICYRSDRKLNDRLQLFIADLKFDGEGAIVGIEREYQITDNDHVNWAPFWHPSGKFLVYGTSEMGHTNYEVFAIEVDDAKLLADGPESPAAKSLRRARVTQANGADVLPVFSPDGKLMMWTGQRGPMVKGDQKPSSQTWVAEFDASSLKFE